MTSLITSCYICGCKDYMEIVTVNGNRNCDRINETHNFVTCEGCGLVYLNPRNTVEDYDYYYQNFDNPGFDKKSLNKIDLLNADYAKELEFIAENIIKRLGFPSKDIKILDCGCGNGLLLYMFKKLGYTNITGLEPAVELVKYAHDVLDINLSQGTVSNNNLETNSFDLVISTSMLDHFHLVSPIDELKAMRSFLRYGGHIFVRVHNYEELVLRKGVHTFFKFVHIYNFTHNSLSNTVRLSGFKVKDIWRHRSLLTGSNLLYPDNYRIGMMNLIAEKVDASQQNNEITRDSPKEVIDLYKYVRWRDFVFRLAFRFINSRYGYPMIFFRKFFNKKSYVEELKDIYK